MAKLWGENLSQQNLSYLGQKLGITRKKTYGYQERNEEERAEFRRKLAKIPDKRRVYVDEAGCELWYLPAYSPDLNKIENWWSVLKTWMKQRLTEFETVRDCVDAAFKNCPNVFA